MRYSFSGLIFRQVNKNALIVILCLIPKHHYPICSRHQFRSFHFRTIRRYFFYEISGLSHLFTRYNSDYSDPAFAGFNEELKPELVYCSLQEAIDDETAEDYVLDELVEDEACPEELRTRAYLKHEVIEGRLYYYYIFKYKKSRKQRQKFAAACDIGGGLFYTIETEWIWRKEELTLEALIDFLNIRVE